LDAPSQIDNIVINPNECSNSTPSQKALFTCIPFKFLTGINATGKLKSENKENTSIYKWSTLFYVGSTTFDKKNSEIIFIQVAIEIFIQNY
jgi:hypothetical protein